MASCCNREVKNEIGGKSDFPPIKMLDLFSGIGGFHLGLEQAGFKFDWVGFSDIDKYANKQYKKRFPNATELGDITNVQPERDLPSNIEILCGGFPCQAFSIAGKRKGFDDIRGTLFFEIARILRHFRDVGKPIPYFILENVKGLLNHEDGRTFATIYGVLADLDYTIECQLLNTRWFLPQNRERIYIVGRFRGESRPKIFPIAEIGYKADELQGQYTNTLKARYEAIGDGSYIVEGEQYAQEGLKQIGTIGEDSEATRVYDPSGCARTIKNGGGMGAKTGLYQVKEATKKGYAVAEEGDSINLSVPDSKTRRGRVGKKAAQTIDTGMQQYTIQNGIRRLTPIECERLQGFPDGWTEGQSDSQRYKQLGNAVSVPVVKAISERLKKIWVKK
tara:strand:+ start:1547 stop:2719 length:1173 start_codon:yes stop_codon:yes gene_type:complete